MFWWHSCQMDTCHQSIPRLKVVTNHCMNTVAKYLKSVFYLNFNLLTLFSLESSLLWKYFLQLSKDSSNIPWYILRLRPLTSHNICKSFLVNVQTLAKGGETGHIALGQTPRHSAPNNTENYRCMNAFRMSRYLAFFSTLSDQWQRAS